MENLLYLPGGYSGRAICLKKRGCSTINTRLIVGGEGAESSYYARERGTYKRIVSGNCNESQEVRDGVYRNRSTLKVSLHRSERGNLSAAEVAKRC